MSNVTVPVEPVATRQRRWLLPTGVFLVALAVRGAYLYDSADYPAYVVPVVDAWSYHEMAAALAHGEGLHPRFFWQPCFYPVFLTCVYLVTGPWVLGVKLIQVVLGALTCALTATLGRRLYGSAAGLVAGLIVALYGPLVFYEAELLAAGWAAFWCAVLLILWTDAPTRRRRRFFLLLGAVSALSVLTRPTFLPFVLAAGVWLLWRLWRGREGPRNLLSRGVVMVAGFVLTLAPVSLLRAASTGEFGFLPAGGGINLYVGNHPESDRLLTAMNFEWDQITRRPSGAGAFTLQEQQAYFTGGVREFARSDPAGFTRGIGRKLLEFVSAREVPRNVSVYVARQWSHVLSGLTWKIGPFGFPAGVLWPLALVGFVLAWRATSTPVKLMVFLFPLAVIMAFVVGRYRLPLVPALALLAGAGCVELARVVRTGALGRLALAGGVAALTLAASVAPGPFALEKIDFETVLLEAVAGSCARMGAEEQAVAYFERAAERDPQAVVALSQLGQRALAAGNLREALALYEQARQAKPDVAAVHLNYSVVLQKRSDWPAAEACLREALRIDPNYALAWAHLGGVLSAQRRFEDAGDAYRQAARLEPFNWQHPRDLARTLLKLRAFEAAADAFRKAVTLNPADPRLRFELAGALEEAGRLEDAAAEYRRVLQQAPLQSEVSQKLRAVESRLQSR